MTRGRAEVTAAGGLGPLLRSLVGLDRKAAKEAFDTFLSGRSPTSAQTEFVDRVIDHVTEHGAVDPRRFYESPFTDLDDQGIHGLFPEADIHEIIAIVQRIDQSARGIERRATGPLIWNQAPRRSVEGLTPPATEGLRFRGSGGIGPVSAMLYANQEND